MSEATDKGIRLSKVAREFNLAVNTVVDFLGSKGHNVAANPNTKIAADLYDLLLDEFGTDKEIKQKSRKAVQQRQERETISLITEPVKTIEEPVAPDPPAAPAPSAPTPASPAPKEEAKEPEVIRARPAAKAEVKVVSRIDLEKKKATTASAPPTPTPPAKPPAPPPAASPPTQPVEPETIRVNVGKLAGPKTVGKIELPVERERKPAEPRGDDRRGRRKRIVKPGPVNIDRAVQQEQSATPGGRPGELDENAVRKKVSETLARLTSTGRSKGARLRRESVMPAPSDSRRNRPHANSPAEPSR